MDEKLERFRRQIDFILEIDAEKGIQRQTHVKGYGRRENDAEHAWHMAVMAYLLKEYANEPIDLAKTMMMILIHDVVEIDAGDTYAYDEAGNATKAERELAAAERIYRLLPEDQAKELMELWLEFEEYQTPEARFAHTMDNFQPLLLNDCNGGEDWRRHDVRISQVLKGNRKTAEGSRDVWRFMEGLLERNVREGNLIDDREQ